MVSSNNMPKYLSKMYKIHVCLALNEFKTQVNESLWSNGLWSPRLLTSEFIRKLHLFLDLKMRRREGIGVKSLDCNFLKQEVTQKSIIASVLDMIKWNNLPYSVRNANLRKSNHKCANDLKNSHSNSTFKN